MVAFYTVFIAISLDFFDSGNSCHVFMIRLESGQRCDTNTNLSCFLLVPFLAFSSQINFNGTSLPQANLADI